MDFEGSMKSPSDDSIFDFGARAERTVLPPLSSTKPDGYPWSDQYDREYATSIHGGRQILQSQLQPLQEGT
ncbi:hypothetical protein N7537_006314 [Penicillium hordei]|uniref:Uncharacterized protein n=1 Tax=Penicillium hordei TaxID=40994 RepID=A0AAD6E7C9_9EURO|nr:uncharacterized protein N7537_006314 [Penicillium hordei]KAJ5603358.1 hypothetical protein N7537_006314 [Penicillium hordei]